MFSKQFMRFIYTNNPVWASVNKSDLAKLRKKTGYTFANCKKALEVNSNDLSLAEKWLKEQAQALGWSKVSKLKGRATLQGLVGISAKGDCGVMVEVNCETDFVARNNKFKSFVDLATQACFKHNLTMEKHQDLSKLLLDGGHVQKLLSPEGKTLSDHCALAISSLGENMGFRRAVFLRSRGNIQLAGFTHPSPENPNTPEITGKYGALIAYTAPSHDAQVQQTARQLCQHIVGMDPTKIGVEGIDEPLENSDEESTMIHQEFLLDPSITVGQLLTSMGIQILDFIRFECGENLDEKPVYLKSASRAA